MSRRYKINNSDHIFFVTFTIVDWVDVFTRPVYKDMFIDSLRFCQEQKGLDIYAYCVMTNHVHLLLAAREDAYLPDIIRDLKKYTSKRIIELVTQENESRREWMCYRFQYHARFNVRNKDYKVWQDGYHGIECDRIPILLQKLDYIHNNPVVAGIVAEPQHYLYSSASNYAHGTGILPVEILDVTYYSGLI